MPKNNRLNNRKTAFTLFRMSIVLLILGIVVIGVAQGIEIIGKARLANARIITNNSPLNSIDGLLLWFETTSEKSFATGSGGVFRDAPSPSDGVQIGKWANLTPNVIDESYRIHATQDTLANQPIYKKDAINGLPALYFDGVNDSFFVTGKTTFTEFTAFFVIRPEYKSAGYSNILNISNRNAGAGNRYISSASSYTNSSLNNPVAWMYIIFPSQQLASVFLNRCGYPDSANSTFFSNFPNIIDNNIILRYTHGYDATGQSIVADIYVNGVKPSQTSTAKPLESTGVLSFRIGLQKDGYTDRNFKGHYGEIILFSRKLDDAEIKMVEGYLADKWRIKI